MAPGATVQALSAYFLHSLASCPAAWSWSKNRSAVRTQFWLQLPCASRRHCPGHRLHGIWSCHVAACMGALLKCAGACSMLMCAACTAPWSWCSLSQVCAVALP